MMQQVVPAKCRLDKFRLDKFGQAALLAFAGLWWSGAATAGPAEVPRAGTLTAQEPIEGAPNGAHAWRIRYRSTAQDGANVEISGVVIAPIGTAPPQGRDVVAWGHSTVGIAESCAPSLSPTLFRDIAGLSALLAAGDVVVATDFQGLGTPGPHPYLVGVSSARAILDAVRAARAIPDASAGRRYVLWGESQGAHAVLWAAGLAAAYAPELTLLGVAAAAPPTALIPNFDKISNPFIRALMTSYASESWSKIYGLKLATFANAVGRVVIRRLASDCVRENAISAARDATLLVLSRQIPVHLGDPWTHVLAENSVPTMRLGVPVLIAQGSADSVVIPEVTHAFVAGMCQAGNAVRAVMIDGGDHTTIAARSQDVTLRWIAGRFAGTPAPSDCQTARQAAKRKS